MWRRLVELARQVVSLYSQMRRQAERTDRLAEELELLRADVKELSDRVGRMEVLLEEREKREATERENLRLQLENLLLRHLRTLPPEVRKETSKQAHLNRRGGTGGRINTHTCPFLLINFPPVPVRKSGLDALLCAVAPPKS